MVIADSGEMDRRYIYHSTASGQFAIVPIEEINRTWNRPNHSDDLDISGLGIVCDSASVDPAEESTVTLLKHEIVEQSAASGVYGLILNPFEEKDRRRHRGKFGRLSVIVDT